MLYIGIELPFYNRTLTFFEFTTFLVAFLLWAN
jgi:hypothetical protein